MDCPLTKMIRQRKSEIVVMREKGRRGWPKSKVSAWHDNSMQINPNIWPHANPLSPLKQIEVIKQIPVPSSSVVKICLSLLQKSLLMSLYFLWFLIVALCHILKASLHSCLLWEIGMWDLCGFVCWFALRICCYFFEPLAGRHCFHADQRATFSRQVFVSHGRANRLCLGQVLLTGRDLKLRKDIPTEERKGLYMKKRAKKSTLLSTWKTGCLFFLVSQP